MHMQQFTALRSQEMDKIHLDTSERTFNAYCKSNCRAAICRAEISYSIPIKLFAIMKAYIEFNAAPDVVIMVVALADLMLGVDVAALIVTGAFQGSSSIHSHLWSC